MQPQFSATSTLNLMRKVAEDWITAGAAVIDVGLSAGVRDILSRVINTSIYQPFSCPPKLSSAHTECPAPQATKGGGRHLVLLQGGESGHLPACSAINGTAAACAELRLAEHRQADRG